MENELQKEIEMLKKQYRDLFIENARTINELERANVKLKICQYYAQQILKEIKGE